MGKTIVISKNVSEGSGTIAITGVSAEEIAENFSFHVEGDAAVDAAVTVKMQESNVHSAGQKDIAGASAIANANTSEYVGKFDSEAKFLNYDINVGTATVGVIKITLYMKQGYAV